MKKIIEPYNEIYVKDVEIGIIGYFLDDFLTKLKNKKFFDWYKIKKIIKKENGFVYLTMDIGICDAPVNWNADVFTKFLLTNHILYMVNYIFWVKPIYSLNKIKIFEHA